METPAVANLKLTSKLDYALETAAKNGVSPFLESWVTLWMAGFDFELSGCAAVPVIASMSADQTRINGLRPIVAGEGASHNNLVKIGGREEEVGGEDQ